MGPNSRPPLTSRIRASFDGKRSHSSESTPHAHINGFAPVDPETLRKAIEQAINSEVFQTAIATSLANIIKPSIKSALDTIQPVVETVYQHDMLLRRTNASVENLLGHFETNNFKRPSRNGDEDFDEDETRPISVTEEPTEAKKATVPDSLSDEQFRSILAEYNTNHTEKSLQALSNVLDGNNKMLTDLITSVDDIHATVAPSTDHITSLRSITEQSTTATSVMQAQLDQLQADVASIIAAVGADGTTIAKAGKNSPSGRDASILATHTTKLDSVAADVAELKDHSSKLNTLKSISENIHNLQSQVGALNSQVGNIRSSVDSHGTRSLDGQGSILAAVQKSHSMHASHSAALDELKSRDIPVPTSILPVQYNSETALALEGLTSDIASLRENMNVRLDTNATQFSTLGTKIDTVLDIVEAIKDGDTNISRGFSDIAPGESHVEPNIENIIKTLDLHTATLATIHSHPSAASRKSIDEDSLERKLEQIVSLLYEIRDSDVSAEILTAIHSCSEIVAEIKESDVSAEILTAIHDSNESHASHKSVLNDVRAYSKAGLDKHVSHAEVLEEIKSSSGSRSIGGENDSVQEKMDNLATILEDHGATLAEVKDAVHRINEGHDRHTAALEDIKSHGTVLADIKEANFNQAAVMDQIQGHSDTLAEIKDAHASHTAALHELKSQVPSSGPTLAVPVDLSGLETQLDAIIDSLDSQKLILSDLKANSASKLVPATTSANPELLNTVKHNHEELLGNIAGLKAAVQESRGDIALHGDAVKALHKDTISAHEETKTSHAGLSDDVKALAIGGGGGAGAAALTSHDKSNNDVLAAIHTVEMAVMEISDKIDSVKGDVEESEMTIKGLLKDASDEIKAEIDASSTDLGSSIGTIGGDVRVLRGVDVRAAVENSRKDIRNAIDVLGEQYKNTGVKVVDVSGGMQNQSRVNSKTMKDLAPEEGSWMKRPSRTKSGTSVPGTAEDTEPVKKNVSPLPTSVVEKEDRTTHTSKDGHETAVELPQALSRTDAIPDDSGNPAVEPSPLVDEEAEEEPESAITSPLSPAFSTDSKGGKKKGKKDKAEKKEKSGKKGKKDTFVFDPEPDQEGEGEGEDG